MRILAEPASALSRKGAITRVATCNGSQVLHPICALREEEGVGRAIKGIIALPARRDVVILDRIALIAEAG